jgi:hypothetical protein
MLQPFQIVHQVHDAFRGLAGKLSRITGKSEVWWRSHGYEPRTANPLANGNKSDVDEYVAYCELLEAAERGAGRLLNNRIYAELEMRFAENDSLTSQDALHVDILEENCDVNKWLASKDFSTATTADLAAFENECDEAIEAITAAKSQARIIKRRLQLSRNVKEAQTKLRIAK